MLPEFSVELDWRGKRYRDVTRGLNVVAKDIEKDFDNMLPVVKREIRKYMEGVVGSVRARVSTPYPSGTSARGNFPGTLSKRSGELARSLDNKQIKDSKTTSEIKTSFTLSGHAVVHENGATIRPKNSQYLTIPLPAALNKNGTPKKPNARAWRNTFIIKSKKGNLLIMQKRGKKDMIPLYVLKKSVTIPKRLAFTEAFEAGRTLLSDVLAKEILKEFNRAR